MEEEVQQDAAVDTPEVEDLAGRLERTVQRYREALIAANPDAVPELIQGSDTEELDRSVEVARAAFARAKEAARAEIASAPTPTNPVRRAGPPVGIEAAGSLAKIAWGLQERN